MTFLCIFSRISTFVGVDKELVILMLLLPQLRLPSSAAVNMSACMSDKFFAWTRSDCNGLDFKWDFVEKLFEPL